MKNVNNLLENYTELSPVEVHYLCMKHFGVRDPLTSKGRPSWNLYDNNSFYHITFGTSEDDSPYRIKESDVARAFAVHAEYINFLSTIIIR